MEHLNEDYVSSLPAVCSPMCTHRGSFEPTYDTEYVALLFASPIFSVALAVLKTSRPFRVTGGNSTGLPELFGTVHPEIPTKKPGTNSDRILRFARNSRFPTSGESDGRLIESHGPRS